MTVFSKYFSCGILARQQLSLYRHNNFNIHSLCRHRERVHHGLYRPRDLVVRCLATSFLAKLRREHPALYRSVRFFRWDAKPDNLMAHREVKHKIYFAPIFLVVSFLALMFNWSELLPIKDRETSSILKAFKDLVREFTGKSKFYETREGQEGSAPSSLTADFYDKHGEQGIVALSEAWEEVKQLDVKNEEKLLHVFMIAEAKLRYKAEVAEQAAEMGLSDDPEVKRLLDKSEQQEENQGDRSQTSSPGMFDKMLSVKAEEAVVLQQEDALELAEDEDGVKVEKLGFRDRKIIEYENRIRQYSTPDKVFRYFATYKLIDEKGNNEVMMTPEDFLRSISPGEKQPENLGLDQYLQISTDEINRMTPLKNLDESSIFYQLGAGGLISFSDYIFLLTVLSTSRRHFEIAFKMFDLNGDGTVDAEEFEKVTTLLRSSSSTGARHRDHGNTGSTFKGINSGLIAFFFGEDKTGTLTVDRFLDFQLKLQEEMLALEFKRKDPGTRGRITERDFADLLIAYAGFSTKKKQKMLRRVKKSYDPEASPGISLKDYLNFYQVLYCINDIDTALTFHTIAGAPIERSTMKHVSRTVAHVELSDHLVDVVFTLFDDNGDGMLSNKEFVSVMKQRAKRGLEKPKEIGISRVFSSVVKCAGDCRPAIMGGIKKTE